MLLSPADVVAVSATAVRLDVESDEDKASPPPDVVVPVEAVAPVVSATVGLRASKKTAAKSAEAALVCFNIDDLSGLRVSNKRKLFGF